MRMEPDLPLEDEAKVSGRKGRGTHRVQMDLSDRSWERLKKLKHLSEATHYADVMKEALKLYEFLMLEDEQGSEFFVRRKDGEIMPIKLFI
jgi:hypothetical protein